MVGTESPAAVESAKVGPDHTTSTKPAQKTFLSKTGTEMVDLIVGPEKTLFRVHKSFLCNKIPYFDKMFNGSFKEASENVATFPEDNPESFDILIEWVYTGQVRKYESSGSGASSSQSWNLFDLYVLAEKLCIPQVMDRALDITRAYHRADDILFTISFVESGYLKTEATSGLKRYLLQTLVFRFHQPDREPNTTDLFQSILHENSDLSGDFLKALRSNGTATPPDPRVGQKCAFHTHVKDEDCFYYKAKKG